MSANTPMRILPLSAKAIAQIRSSKHITSLEGVVLALLENCLDAEASRVEISVDWRRGGAQVNDNGIGIPSPEFDEGGSLGKLYCTSKRSIEGIRLRETHGTSGTFLAELATMSLLSIASTHVQSHGATAILTLHHGKVITRRLSDPTMVALDVGKYSGTDVTVRDLFGNMPVRIKQRALAGDTNHEDDKSWHELKRGVVALLLAWPKPCSVNLRDANSEAKLVTISGYRPGAPKALTMKHLNQLEGRQVKSDLRDTLPILLQSGFAQLGSRSRWVPLSASTSAISLKGLICLDPAPTKQCQFLSLGITPFSATAGHTELYDVVAKAFSSSCFGILGEPTGTISVGHGREKVASVQTGKQLQARKGVDRFPMYNIQLKFKDHGHDSEQDLDRLSVSSLQAVVDILEAAVMTWLESNHFRPRKKRRRRNEEQESPSGPLQSSPGVRSAHPDIVALFHKGSGGDGRVDFPHSGTQRRVINLSEMPSRLDIAIEPDVTADAEDLSTLSSMRFGSTKHRPQTALHLFSTRKGNAEDQRAKSTASAHPHAGGLAMSVKKRRPLEAPSIDVGELGGVSKRHGTHIGGVQSFEHPQTSDSAGSRAITASERKGGPSSDDFGSIEDAELLGAEEAARQAPSEQIPIGEDEDNDCTTWTDPVSKQIFRVNSRTGVVLPLSAVHQSNSTITTTRQRAAIDATLSSMGKPLSLARRSVVAGKGSAERPSNADDATWLPDFLRRWDNPVFARRKEEPIPVASLDGPGPLEIDASGKCCSRNHLGSRSDESSTGTKLTKTALREAEVVAQVDMKFILCKIPASPNKLAEKSTLLLIDQHAASERVILEDLLTELCTPVGCADTSVQTTCLRSGTARAQVLVVEVSAKEIDLFARYRAHFARWGVLYNFVSPKRFDSHHGASEINESRVHVTHLPTPVAERCANFPSLAIEMLRSEAWALEDGSRKLAKATRTPADAVRDHDQPLWLSLLSSIPPSLLALLHSRSCRSAVMFNDVLSRKQCVELVKRLGDCVFPFICAHGRVSMVPLGDIDGTRADVGGNSQGAEGQAMSAWLRTRRSNSVEN